MKLKHGNPLKDRAASLHRFKTGVEPILSNKQFKRINDSNHHMINNDNNIIVICQSCPSSPRMFGELKNTIRQYRKKYGKHYTFYVHFNREKIEWIDKSVYVSTLNNYLKISKLNGIIVGISELVSSIPQIMESSRVYRI